MKGHKKILEATNGGNYFADCSCGSNLGVYRSRAIAIKAHAAHLSGLDGPAKVKPIILLGRSHDEQI